MKKGLLSVVLGTSLLALGCAPETTTPTPAPTTEPPATVDMPGDTTPPADAGTTTPPATEGEKKTP